MPKPERKYIRFGVDLENTDYKSLCYASEAEILDAVKETDTNKIQRYFLDYKKRNKIVLSEEEKKLDASNKEKFDNYGVRLKRLTTRIGMRQFQKNVEKFGEDVQKQNDVNEPQEQKAENDEKKDVEKIDAEKIEVEIQKLKLEIAKDDPYIGEKQEIVALANDISKELEKKKYSKYATRIREIAASSAGVVSESIDDADNTEKYLGDFKKGLESFQQVLKSNEADQKKHMAQLDAEADKLSETIDEYAKSALPADWEFYNVDTKRKEVAEKNQDGVYRGKEKKAKYQVKANVEKKAEPEKAVEPEKKAEQKEKKAFFKNVWDKATKLLHRKKKPEEVDLMAEVNMIEPVNLEQKEQEKVEQKDNDQKVEIQNNEVQDNRAQKNNNEIKVKPAIKNQGPKPQVPPVPPMPLVQQAEAPKNNKVANNQKPAEANKDKNLDDQNKLNQAANNENKELDNKNQAEQQKDNAAEQKEKNKDENKDKEKDKEKDKDNVPAQVDASVKANGQKDIVQEGVKPVAEAPKVKAENVFAQANNVQIDPAKKPAVEVPKAKVENVINKANDVQINPTQKKPAADPIRRAKTMEEYEEGLQGYADTNNVVLSDTLMRGEKDINELDKAALQAKHNKMMQGENKLRALLPEKLDKIMAENISIPGLIRNQMLLEEGGLSPDEKFEHYRNILAIKDMDGDKYGKQLMDYRLKVAEEAGREFDKKHQDPSKLSFLNKSANAIENVMCAMSRNPLGIGVLLVAAINAPLLIVGLLAFTAWKRKRPNPEYQQAWKEQNQRELETKRQQLAKLYNCNASDLSDREVTKALKADYVHGKVVEALDEKLERDSKKEVDKITKDYAKAISKGNNDKVKAKELKDLARKQISPKDSKKDHILELTTGREERIKSRGGFGL